MNMFLKFMSFDIFTQLLYNKSNFSFHILSENINIKKKKNHKEMIFIKYFKTVIKPPSVAIGLTGTGHLLKFFSVH